ncbi:MAG: hypothetical protein QW818_01810 [Candidatus Aenigmatarchaeota archaeon]|nr:hypothetical protein [Candidatus Aenigmarchaeota archaeon]
MPYQYVEANFVQLFDEKDFRLQRGLTEDKRGFLGGYFLGHSFSNYGNVELNGITTFGPSVKADLNPFGTINMKEVDPKLHSVFLNMRPFLLAQNETQYVAGRFIGDGKKLYLEVGSEDSPKDLEILFTQMTIQNKAGEELTDVPFEDIGKAIGKLVNVLFEHSVLLRPGDKVDLYDLTPVHEQIIPSRSYLLQFGTSVNYHPSLEKTVRALPQMRGKIPRYYLFVDRHIVHPLIRLIGLIPEGETKTQAVTAEIYARNVLELPEDVIAGSPEITPSEITLELKAVGEYSIKPQSVEELEKIARISEKVGQKVPLQVYLGDIGDTPEELLRKYIMRELFPHLIKEMVGSDTIPDDFKYRINIDLRQV